MKDSRLSRVTLTILSLVGVFLLAVSLATASLIWSARKSALTDARSQATRFVSGAEAALNRNLLGVDVLLASMDELLQLAHLTQDKIDTKAANRLMNGAVQQNLMLNYVALISPKGLVIASSVARGARLAVSLPDGFLSEVLALPVSAMVISAPVVSFASAEQVLYLARHVNLADATKVIAVAEVRVPYLTSILVQGADISGLEVTMERSNGQLLASEPALQELSGKLLTPAMGLSPDAPAGQPLMRARLSGAAAVVVTRPILYNDVLLSASIPLEAALIDWKVERNLILATALAFALMVVAAGIFAAWYLKRMLQTRQAIAQSKTVLDQALESMVSGFVLLNAERQVLSWNRRFIELFPWVEGTIAPLLPFQTILDISATFRLPNASNAERQQWIAHRTALQLNAQGTHDQYLPNKLTVEITERITPTGGLVILYQDVSAMRAATAEIEHLAFFDPLTGLPNRRLLMDRLQHALNTSTRSGHFGALLFLDLDHFKNLNDTLGHDVGDLLLQQVAQRLTVCVREEDTVARLGGDEFVVMIENLSRHSHVAATMAQRIGEKILDRLNYPYQLTMHTCHNTSSVGAALFCGATVCAADLLKQADIAMYQVKSHGRNALCFFDPKMQAAITARAQLLEDLHTALENQQFELYYQPQLALGSGPVGAEVLIRWQHPQRGMVSPLEFIPVAEESELILPIGQWVLRTACLQLAIWQTAGPSKQLSLSVNVSARQFRQADFVKEVADMLLATGANPKLLKLELTESLVLDNVDDTVAKMRDLKALGVRFSLDDFGTGHSSLAYLTRLPLDQLKIDQSFVRNIGTRHTDGVIVQTIIGMAANLGLEVIAEGVETPEQAAFLANQGCTLYQGYLYGKPTPLADFEALLT